MVKKKSEQPKENDKGEDIPKSAPQVNDVAKPGETAATPTSRPIIVGRGGMIKQDPMVVDGKDEEAVEAAGANTGKLSKRSAVTIEPVSEEAKEPADAKLETENEDNSPDDSTNQPAEDGQDTGKDEESSQDEEQPDDSAKREEDDSSDSAEIESLATSAEARKLSAKQEEEDQKRSQQIQELISSKKYFVPIVEGGHKASSQRFMSWLLLLLLLVAVATYMAIDAGYLDVGISLPYDIIRN